MHLLAIDPGDTESGYALVDTTTCRPLEVAKVPNEDLLDGLWTPRRFTFGASAIEMVASYGMPVGREVFETCVWIGRFAEAIDRNSVHPARLVYRKDVKLHHCYTTQAKDSNITQALVDRFAPGQPNKGKGTKDAPGWFYGFAKDMWQAYALAVLEADRAEDRAA